MGEMSFEARASWASSPTDEILHETNSLKDSIHKMQSQLADLSNRICKLEKSDPQICKERIKYITYFKRNMLHKTPYWHRNVGFGDGNEKIACDGKIMLDAYLYERFGARWNREVFE